MYLAHSAAITGFMSYFTKANNDIHHDFAAYIYIYGFGKIERFVNTGLLS